MELLARLAVGILAVQDEDAFMDVLASLEKRGGFEGSEHLAAAGDVPDAIASLKCGDVRDVRAVFVFKLLERADEAVFDGVFPDDRAGEIRRRNWGIRGLAHCCRDDGAVWQEKPSALCDPGAGEARCGVPSERGITGHSSFSFPRIR